MYPHAIGFHVAANPGYQLVSRYSVFAANEIGLSGDENINAMLLFSIDCKTLAKTVCCIAA